MADIDATINGSWGEFTGAITAADIVLATAMGTWGAFTGVTTATPKTPIQAVSIGSWGSLTANTNAGDITQAVAIGSWGGLTEVVGAIPTVLATPVSALWGGIAGTGTAVVTVHANPTGAWAGLTGLALPIVTVHASSAGLWGGLTGIAFINYQNIILGIPETHKNTTQFQQPNMTRSRQALRSPKNSESLNLEMSLFTYDVLKLYEKVSLAEATMSDNFNTLSEDFITKNSASNNQLMVINSLHDAGLRLEALNDRLEVLEKGLV